MPFIAAAATIGAAGIGYLSNQSAADTAAQGATDAANINSAAQTKAAQITADANAQALDKQLGFNQQAQDAIRAASQRGLGDIDTGVQDYTSTVNPLLTPAPITLPSYRGLTTSQQTAEQDMLRNSNAQIAASGLRGAGRAGVGSILDQDRRFHEDAAAANDASILTAKQNAQGVANNARTGLAGVQAAAGGSKANTELLTGNNLGNILTNSGSAAANLTQATGTAGANAAANSGKFSADATNAAAGYSANATLADGKLFGNTIGSLAGTYSSPYAGNSGNPNLYTSPTQTSGYAGQTVDTSDWD